MELGDVPCRANQLKGARLVPRHVLEEPNQRGASRDLADLVGRSMARNPAPFARGCALRCNAVASEPQRAPAQRGSDELRLRARDHSSGGPSPRTALHTSCTQTRSSSIRYS